MSLVVQVAIAGVIAATLILFVMIWALWRHYIKLLFLNRKEITVEAGILLDRHGNRAPAFVRDQEFNAWRHGNYAAQARWHMIERAIFRLQRKGVSAKPVNGHLTQNGADLHN